MLKATIIVKLKDGIDDPEGKSIKHSLNLLGFDSVVNVHVSKYYEILLDLPKDEGEREVQEMLKKLLVNPVIHEYELRVEEI